MSVMAARRVCYNRRSGCVCANGSAVWKFNFEGWRFLLCVAGNVRNVINLCGMVGVTISSRLFSMVSRCVRVGFGVEKVLTIKSGCGVCGKINVFIVQGLYLFGGKSFWSMRVVGCNLRLRNLDVECENVKENLKYVGNNQWR